VSRVSRGRVVVAGLLLACSVLLGASLGLASTAGASTPALTRSSSVSSALPVEPSYVVSAGTSSSMRGASFGSSVSDSLPSVMDVTGWDGETVTVALAALIWIAGMVTLSTFARL